MDCFVCPKQELIFRYNHEDLTDQSFEHSMKVPLDSNVSAEEYCIILMKTYRIPEYLYQDLIEKFNDFLFDAIDNIQSKQIKSFISAKDKLLGQSKRLLEKLQNVQSDSVLTRTIVNQIVGNEKSLKKSEEIVQEKSFYQMYHAIIHSGILTKQLIQLENHNSDVIMNLLAEKEEYFQNLSDRQNQIIEEVLLSGQYNEKEINLLTQSHIQAAEKSRIEWNQRIDKTRSDQKNEFDSWIKNTYEDLMRDEHQSLPKQNSEIEEEFNQSMILNDSIDGSDFVDLACEPEMQESYTINLGSQLKTTHNLRLIAADIFQYCSHSTTPHRIQTAMSLYSDSLSAAVLLADNSLSNSNFGSHFFQSISRTSENHFPSVKTQIDLIRSDLMNGCKHLNKERKFIDRLKVGDVYVTKHSNLSDVHLVFHMATDDSIKNIDINSRHPVILGLRNILKIAFIYDISNIYLPLLLLHRMDEDITIQWCLKRAELVLKCVKGFMIEMSSLISLNENEHKTIQFVVPKGISNDLFGLLSAIFPNVFRLSNPLFLTKSYANEN
ncbi:hypothetical protein SSS_01298 [Sarcoptes scabiei]|uniref:DUF2362 domain containing protein n=1 Tax=Sarcoptes scabiei TaxID=52283 RepID=A0A132AM08_SARSC|nr:hypothetical protein SSS_01298 [Sarcoptes scabiei]KPM11967.1 DUF2362 domain containing protein [Sarcoptes scabiei]UXI14319.1 hypothetical protein NH340_JMT00262 [Sarcoptes scabiei]